MKRARRARKTSGKIPKAAFFKEELSRGDGRKFVFYWFKKGKKSK